MHRGSNRPFNVGEIIDLRWDEFDGWWPAEIIGRCRKNDSIKDANGIPVPSSARWDVVDLRSGELYPKYLDDSNFEKIWRYHDEDNSEKAFTMSADGKVTHKNLLLRAVSTLLTVASFPPRVSGLLIGDYPLKRNVWSDSSVDPLTVPWEQAKTTREYGLLGGTAEQLSRELTKCKVEFVKTPGAVCPLTTSELKAALAQGARVAAIDPSLPGLTDEEKERRTTARAFCAEAGQLLFSSVEPDNTEDLEDDRHLWH